VADRVESKGRMHSSSVQAGQALFKYSQSS
jgi:hypothetical protein